MIDPSVPRIPADDVRRALLSLNPTHDFREVLSTPTWDIRLYDRRNRPMIVGWIPEALRAELSRQRGQRVQDLCIKMPGQGWALPEEFAPYQEALRIAVATERAVNPDFARDEGSWYAYLTVDQKQVAPRRTQRRPGFHGDAFVTPEVADLTRPVLCENTYLVCDGLPTEFKEGPFDISAAYPDDQACLAAFDEQAATMPTIHVPAYAVARITPFHVHSPAVNDSDAAIERTFLKITFSKERFNRRGNAINPLLNYDGWLWVERAQGIRNHRTCIIDWNRSDGDRYLAVDPTHLSQEWCDSRVFWARKVEGVRAERAVPHSHLETVVGKFAMTAGIAQVGDWLITTGGGDRYFLSDEKFRARYQPSPDKEGLYLPRHEVVPMVRLTAHVKFRAPWGAMQYAPSGSVLVLKPGDVYAIHEDSFLRAYEVVGDSGRTDLAGKVVQAVRAALFRGGELLVSGRRQAAGSATLKPDGTVVCSADGAIQGLVAHALLRHPDLAGHVYLHGEEDMLRSGVSPDLVEQNRRSFGSAEFVVALDPLDNSKGYATTDIGRYATVAAVLHRGHPIYYLAIAPELGRVYEAVAAHPSCGRMPGARLNDKPLPAFEDRPRQNLLAAGLHWTQPPDPLRLEIGRFFQVADRFGSFQVAAAEVAAQESDLDAVLTSGFGYHETIPAASILSLVGAQTLRDDGSPFFPLSWSDLGLREPCQLLAGTPASARFLAHLRKRYPQR